MGDSLEDYSATVSERYVWCTCGWIVEHAEALLVASERWYEHMEAAHTSEGESE